MKICDETAQAATYTGGRLRLIADLLADGSHRVEAWGNRHEGFCLMLTSGAPGYLRIGGPFIRLSHLRRAVQVRYGRGRHVAVPIGQNWH